MNNALLIGWMAFLLIAPSAGAADSSELALGEKVFEEGRFADAASIFKQAIRKDPNNAAAYCFLGRAQVELSQFDEAVASLEKAVQLDPSSSDIHHRLAEAYGGKLKKAGLLSQAGLARKTREELEKAIELDPKNVDAREDLVEFYLEAPALVGGSVEKAMQEAQAIGAIRPEEGYRQRAKILEHQKKLGEAEAVYREGVAKYPDYARLHFNLGSLLVSQKKWDDALAIYEAVGAKEEFRWAAYYQYGRTAAISGRGMPRARELLTTFVDTKPSGRNVPPLAWAYYRLGQIEAALGNQVAARTALETSVKLDPKLEEARKALKALG
ncbi:MAG TPA: tetratricopeptide repeat protein [Thermoanaerobaculia bacterium]|nr:tetratricopeptide repeat protein [Thermoanaerobaculia bacterium]